MPRIGLCSARNGENENPCTLAGQGGTLSGAFPIPQSSIARMPMIMVIAKLDLFMGGRVPAAFPPV